MPRQTVHEAGLGTILCCETLTGHVSRARAVPDCVTIIASTCELFRDDCPLVKRVKTATPNTHPEQQRTRRSITQPRIEAQQRQMIVAKTLLDLPGRVAARIPVGPEQFAFGDLVALDPGAGQLPLQLQGSKSIATGISLDAGLCPLWRASVRFPRVSCA